MNQSSVIFGTLVAAFVLFVAARGNLKNYTAVLWGSTKEPLPSSRTTGIPLGNQDKGNGGGGGGGPSLPLPGAGGGGVGEILGNGLSLEQFLATIPELAAVL
jgi:hypothetical protein